MNTSLASLIRKTGFRYGIMLGALSSALFLTFGFLKLSASFIPMLSGLAFTIALIYLAHLYFKENNDDGTMTFGQGVTISFLVGLSLGFFSPPLSLTFIPSLLMPRICLMRRVSRWRRTDYPMRKLTRCLM